MSYDRKATGEAGVAPANRTQQSDLDRYSKNAATDRCRKCGGEMKPGKALRDTYVASPDFIGYNASRGVTMNASGQTEMVDCMKCAGCGWSVTR